jgi:hypothetical protein
LFFKNHLSYLDRASYEWRGFFLSFTSVIVESQGIKKKENKMQSIHKSPPLAMVLSPPLAEQKRISVSPLNIPSPSSDQSTSCESSVVGSGYSSRTSVDENTKHLIRNSVKSSKAIETKDGDPVLGSELQRDARMLFNVYLREIIDQYRLTDTIEVWISRYHFFLLSKRDEIADRLLRGYCYCVIVEPVDFSRVISSNKRKALEFCIRDLDVVKAFRFPDEHGCILLLFDEEDPVKAWTTQLHSELEQSDAPLVMLLNRSEQQHDDDQVRVTTLSATELACLSMEKEKARERERDLSRTSVRQRLKMNAYANYTNNVSLSLSKQANQLRSSRPNQFIRTKGSARKEKAFEIKGKETLQSQQEQQEQEELPDEKDASIKENEGGKEEDEEYEAITREREERMYGQVNVNHLI